MENMPTVSVIMSTAALQDVGYLITAIQSVLEQTFTDFELILCNDGAGEEQANYLHRLAGVDKRIKLIDNPENKGFAHSMNLCIHAARGKYLARMDDDDICEPERLKVQFDYLERHTEIDFVGCNARLISGDKVWGYRRMPERPGKKDFLKFLPYIHPSVMFRRQIFEGQEGYRTDTCRGEDYDLFMRLTASGHQGYNIQQALISYREDLDSYKRRDFRSRLDEVRIRYKGFLSLGIFFALGMVVYAETVGGMDRSACFHLWDEETVSWYDSRQLTICFTCLNFHTLRVLICFASIDMIWVNPRWCKCEVISYCLKQMHGIGEKIWKIGQKCTGEC